MPRTNKLLAIDHSCVLLVYKGESGQFSLPGGKRNGKEKDLRCLRRELKEELPRLRVRRFKRWKRFNMRYRRQRFTMTIFFGKVSGSLRVAKEIDAAAWVRISSLGRIPLSSNTKRILDRAKKDGYLKR
jgi:8-oxo-dGTP diphosphatase